MPLSLEGRPSEAVAIGVIHSVLDAGVTLLDTADCYCLGPDEVGHNERLIQKALATWSGDRARITVATKGGSTRPDTKRWKVDGRPDHLRAAADQSLRSLGVDTIDLYQLHGPDPGVPFADSVGALAELQRAGKIRCVGLSNVNVKQIDVARKIVPIQSVQNILNPFFQGASRGRLLRPSVVAHCHRHGMGFLAFSPAGGLLHRKLPQQPVLQQIAQRHGVSPFRVAVAWLLTRGQNVIPIPAARSIDHAADSLAAAELELTPEEIASIDRAKFER